MMPIRSTLLSALAGVLVALSLSPGAAYAAREQRNTGDFQAVVASGSFEVQIRQGERTQVELDGDEAVLAKIETVVESGDNGPVLQIRQKDKGGWFSGNTGSKVVVRIVTPKLQSMALRGSGDLKLEAFSTPQLVVSVAGSGDASLTALSTERLTVSLAGSGDVRGDGRTKALKLSIAGSGDARLRGLLAETVDVGIAGAGDAEVHADKSLGVSIAGSGDVRYGGNPSLKTSIAGSGTVKSLR